MSTHIGEVAGRGELFLSATSRRRRDNGIGMHRTNTADVKPLGENGLPTVSPGQGQAHQAGRRHLGRGIEPSKGTHVLSHLRESTLTGCQALS